MFVFPRTSDPREAVIEPAARKGALSFSDKPQYGMHWSARENLHTGVENRPRNFA
jgi:hypothetical protein